MSINNIYVNKGIRLSKMSFITLWTGIKYTYLYIYINPLYLNRLCPSFNQAMSIQLSKYLGRIDEQVIVLDMALFITIPLHLPKQVVIHNILPTVQTGNLHIVVSTSIILILFFLRYDLLINRCCIYKKVYDLTDNLMFVSFCRFYNNFFSLILQLCIILLINLQIETPNKTRLHNLSMLMKDSSLH